MTEIEFEAIFPAISGALKTTADGGARITLEVDETVALMIHTFKLSLGEQTIKVKMGPVGVKTYG